MQCIICKCHMSYFFSKYITNYDLGVVDYWRCSECGFVASATHFEMSQNEWEKLNIKFHSDAAMMKDNPEIHQPPYAEQAMMINLMYIHRLLMGEPWLDWGAGQAEVSQILANQYGLNIINFDRFIEPPFNAISEDDIQHGTYNLVLSSAVFEHVRNRNTLDEIDACVTRDNGVLGVHTLVRGEIPQDPTWMYLLPVHCAFHTNRSMQILMDQWGYCCSAYNEHSKLWAMFRKSGDFVRAQVAELNSVVGYDYLHYKKGFMDFWP